MWFAIGVFYHIGAVGEEEGIQEELIFWSVDIVMNHLGTITRTVLQNHVRRMLELIREYFEKWHQRLVTLTTPRCSTKSTSKQSPTSG